MAWMTQPIPRVLEAWPHTGPRRVDGAPRRPIAPVHVPGLHLRGVGQWPVVHYRNRLLLGTSSEPASGPMPPPGRHTNRRKRLSLPENGTQQHAQLWILPTPAIVG